MPAPDPVPDARPLLDLVRDSALRLHAEFSLPPSVLRVRVGDVVIEAEWAAAAAAAGDAAAGDAVAPPSADDAAGPVVRAEADLVVVRAPASGTFYRAAEPGAGPFVAVGDAVVVGTQVGVVEVMQLMVPVHADLDGVITQAQVADGEPVRYDQPLFTIDTRRGR
ncbi:acetyl-CoA carboxylase biotin carboxyl carrier protein [Nocardia sp. NPDC057353]|uniref:acetyl-CoA carboxylase biotin carboxyl carrier protein n=1 Tax=Nocardia sp. NPDC057353 TaxID=3346104 RepID=UPI0036286A3C